MRETVVITDRESGQVLILDAEVAGNLGFASGQVLSNDEIISYHRSVLLLLECLIDDAKRTPHRFLAPIVLCNDRCATCTLEEAAAVHHSEVSG